jgi:uncharacterized membrane protein YkvA (DUF1232 family)
MSQASGSTGPLGPDIQPDTLARPLSQEEMEFIRRSMQDERRLGLAVLALIKRFAKRIPFAADALSAWYCATDAATPTRVKGVLLAALAYFILPFDVIPDIIPILGFTDDAAVLAAAITAVAGSITDEHRMRARQLLNDL